MKTVNELIDRIESGEEFQYLFFWGHHEKPNKVTKACFSQWYPCEFECEGIKYNCAEQYMMAEKARVFGDEETRKKILEAQEPDIIKQLGREVRNFDAEKWDSVSYDVVVKGNMCKFAQNIALWTFLHETEDIVLVEASPYDTIWGIGMKQAEAETADPRSWKGTNKLGFALMEVRATLLAE